MKMYANSHFYIYFDGEKVITDNEFHIPDGIGKVKEHRFIVVNEDTEFWKPEEFALIAKENGLALYTVNHDDDILYRNGKEYTIMFRYGKKSKFVFKQKVIFETEKPLDEETFGLIKRIHDNKDKTKLVKIEDEEIGFFEVEILDYNDVCVYTGEDNGHRLVVIDNAEIVRVDTYEEEYRIEKLIAIKGDKTYLGTEQSCFPVEGNCIKVGGKMEHYISKWGTFEYVLNVINIIKRDRNKCIVEISSLDSEITVRKLLINEIPMIIGTQPPTLHCKSLPPIVIEEKTYKVKELVNTLTQVYY